MRFLSGLKILLSAAVLLASPNLYALPQMNMAPGVTPISREMYFLHMTIFWICVVIGVIVFSIMFYSLIRHRKSRGVKPATFHENLKLEIFWAIIPLIILVVMAFPATKVLLNMEDDSDADINIKVTGFQWKWRYEYLDEGLNFFSNLATPLDQIQNKAPKDEWYLLEVDKPLVVPVHKKIRFLVTSNDVVHSWWVPHIGIKRDAIPGFIHEAWAKIDRPGIYRGQCAELCGLNHGFMPIVVDARPEADYLEWVKAQKLAASQPPGTVQSPSAPMTKPELMSNGEQVYTRLCAVCHQPTGKGMPPAFPALIGSPITVGKVSEHIHIVLKGKPGTAMQAFELQLNDKDLASVITYERNAWGNDSASKYGKEAGGLIQPSDIATARKQLNGK
ncbi:MAG: cytochrome c oxidase subunit II [Gammaproteobacteria bacterium]|nr:cytochrome c oxidase subunit II [Gammaproteobacteria bacterium]